MDRATALNYSPRSGAVKSRRLYRAQAQRRRRCAAKSQTLRAKAISAFSSFSNRDLRSAGSGDFRSHVRDHLRAGSRRRTRRGHRCRRRAAGAV